MATKNKSMAKIVGGNIASIRRASKITQVQLAKKLKKSQPEISAWERGDHEPQLLTLKAIAKALKVSAADLLAGT